MVTWWKSIFNQRFRSLLNEIRRNGNGIMKIMEWIKWMIEKFK